MQYYTSLTLTVQHPAFLKTTEQLWFQELADCNVLSQTLPPASLKDKVACQLLCGRRFERSGCDVLVERVARDDRPAVEDEGEGDLTLCVDLREVSICSM